MITVLRRLLGHVCFYLCIVVWTLGLGLGGLPLLCAPIGFVIGLSRLWVRGLLHCARIFLGIRMRITGPIPSGPLIIACKHQSVWETLALTLLVHHPVFVLKKSLLHVPLIGWFLRRLGMIAVARGQSKSMKSLLQQARLRVHQEGRPLVIFPEGTRTAIGQKPHYHKGVILIAHHLSLPVIPTALNAGLFWPKRGLWKHPGTIDLVFLPALPMDLSDRDLFASLVTAIEDATHTLCQTVDAHTKTSQKSP
jgi:1-acyl-sn-glycerol-3-phosphate acyltransferase